MWSSNKHGRSRRASTLLAVVSFLAGCSRFEIQQQWLFTNARSVTPSDFPYNGYELEELSLTVEDGVTIDGWRMYRPMEPAEGPRAAVLYFGGQGYHMVLSAHIFDALLAILPRGVDLYTFDYRGYGKSEGEPGVDALLRDAMAIWAFVRDRPDTDAARLGLHGQSMGSFMASYVAAETNAARAVVLEAPVTSAQDWLETVIPGWVRMLLRPTPVSPLDQPDNAVWVEQFDAPLLLVAGSEDPIAPPDLARTLLERARSKQKSLVVVEGGSHNDLPGTTPFQTSYHALMEDLIGQ
ncbi:MAG: alpha/beta fold hydrolase [Myxococcota bacterium]